MFGLMKKAMVVGTIVAAGTLVPAVASADVWSSGGAPYAGPAHVQGTVTWTLPANGWTTTCDIGATVNLANPGSPAQAAGTITDAAFGTPVSGNGCTTSLPDCAVTPYAAGLPGAPGVPLWTVTTAGTGVTIGGFTLAYTYEGSSCPVDGLTMTLVGSVEGAMTVGSNVIAFANAPGLTTPLASARLNGSLSAYVADAAGVPDVARPVTLVP